jgi:hypothetical protein
MPFITRDEVQLLSNALRQVELAMREIEYRFPGAAPLCAEVVQFNRVAKQIAEAVHDRVMRR